MAFTRRTALVTVSVAGRLAQLKHRGESALGQFNLAMQETNEPKANTWKRPLKRWRWLAGWAW
jgi:hypothetical protein